MATKTMLSWQEFLAAGKLDQRREYVDGEVKLRSLSGVRHGLMIRQISVAVERFVSTNPSG